MEQGTPALAGQWEQRDRLWAASSTHLQLETPEEMDGEEDEDEEKHATQLSGGQLLPRDIVTVKVNNEYPNIMGFL